MITRQSLNYASIPLCEAIPFHYPAPSALAAAKLNQLVGSWPKSQEVIRLPKPSRPNGLFPKKGKKSIEYVELILLLLKRIRSAQIEN